MKRINVVDQSGQVGSLSPDEFKEAKGFGFREATDKEVNDYFDKEKYGQGFGNEAAAFGESALGTATFGGSRVLENKLGITTPEAQAAREKYNPTASGAGVGVGLIAPLLVAPEAEAIQGARAGLTAAKATGEAAEIGRAGEALNAAKVAHGSDLVAGDALNPVSAVSKLGQKTARALTPALPENAGLIRQILTQAPGAIAGSSVEGAAYGLGQSINESALGDPDALGQKLVSNVGYGAFLGGALGGALKVGELAIPSAVGKARDALTKLSMAGGEGEVGPLGRAYAKTSSFVSGKPEESILDAIKNRADFIENPEVRLKMAQESAAGLQKLHEELNKALKTTNGEIRPEEIYQTLNAMPIETAKTHANDVWNKVFNTINEMEMHPALYPKAVSEKLRGLAEEFSNQTVNATHSGEVFKAIDGLKQNLDKKFNLFGRMISPEWDDAANALKGLRSDIKNHLENEANWGQAGARQAAFNDAQNLQYHLTGKGGAFRKAFMEPVPTRSGKVTYQISPNKVQTFFKQIHTMQGSQKAAAYDAFVHSSRNLLDQIEQSYKSAPGRTFDRGAIESIVNRNVDMTQKAMRQADIARNLGMLSGGGHNAYLGEGAALGVGAFHPALGAAIEGFNLVRNPSLAVQRLAKLEKIGAQTSKVISKAAKSIFNAGTKVGEESAGIMGSRLAPSDITHEKAADKKTKAKEIIVRLQELQGDPSKMVDTLVQSTQGLSEHAPQTAEAAQQTATRATQYLASKAPQLAQVGPLQREPELSNAEVSKFERTYNLIEQPTSILDHVKMGTITPEGVEAVATVYPKLYQEITQAVTEEMTNVIAKKGKDAIPYRTKMALSVLLNQDMDTGLTQPRLLANQNALASSNAQSKADEAQQTGRPSGKGMKALDQSGSMLTAAQKSAQRA